MNILVLMKQTFDTEEKIVLQNGTISEEGANFIINPYDEYAIEEAIQLREEHGGEVTVITVGPERSENALRTALAMGADKAVRVDSEDLNLDQYSTAKILEAVIKDRDFNIILGGNMAVDYSSGQVGPRLAEALNIPQVTTVTKLQIDGNRAIVERDVEGDKEVVIVSLPVLITAQQGLNEPRYPSLPGIMKAKNKPIERLEIGDLDFDKFLEVKTIPTEIFFPPKKGAGRMLNGEIKTQVSELAVLLRSEAKVI
ncbi:electron transfer flavoprotein subunit beta/FixA family protein [Neobacillus cucumis]|uniref:electron transfer flavoprotein subunit beta/FixA family protein n=1 Tax=Neobacillus cucumis TaxID=1740721 RepID=UPI0018DF42D3|nr:electron transfer flavoprotein subunit beta/FixA family protein [Neobacillus cucumis]MBI0575881.1 electron transfer flavoprotein subunit beta/FixA family protein [Neobacillus cucumis]WHY90076.1 electron transfer flavoprotein subunit beta/FixA family protein [Neobacillus cucumis]